MCLGNTWQLLTLYKYKLFKNRRSIKKRMDSVATTWSGYYCNTGVAVSWEPSCPTSHCQCPGRQHRALDASASRTMSQINYHSHTKRRKPLADACTAESCFILSMHEWRPRHHLHGLYRAGLRNRFNMQEAQGNCPGCFCSECRISGKWIRLIR